MVMDFHGLYLIYIGRNAYRLYNLFIFRVPLPVPQSAICVAPFGGLIGEANRTLDYIASLSPMIFIYDACGNLFASLPKPIGFVAMDWSVEEKLIIVTNDSIIIHDFCGGKKSFPLEGFSKDEKIKHCKFYSSLSTNGIAFLMESKNTSKFYVLKDIKSDRSLVHYKGLSNQFIPQCWQIITPQDSIIVIVVAVESTVYKFYPTRSELLKSFQPEIKVMNMAICKNGQKFAFLLSDNTISIYFLNGDILRQINSGILKFKYEDIKDFLWCCNEILCVRENNNCLFLITNENVERVMGNNIIYIVPEIDGIRIITNTTNSMLQKIPELVTKVIEIDPNTPSSFLYQAIVQYEAGSLDAHGFIQRMTRDELKRAVDECIIIAGHMPDYKMQSKFLRAASLGKLFLPAQTDDESFTNMCKMIKILNTLHQDDVAILITSSQWVGQNLDRLISRLMMRNKYWVAIEIDKFWNGYNNNKEQIIHEWALSKIDDKKLTDEEVSSLIREKVQSRIIELAKYAIEKRRETLGLLILDLENASYEHISLLLDLRKFSLALDKAIDTCDVNLIIEVIDKFKECDRSGFLKTLKHSEAYNLYTKHLLIFNIKELEDIYSYYGDKESLGYLKMYQSYHDNFDINKRENIFNIIHSCFNKDSIEYQLINEEKTLINKHKSYINLHKGLDFSSCSVMETIEKLFLIDDHEANELKSKFGVSNVKFFICKVNFLVKMGKWRALEDYVKSTSLPTSSLSIMKICIKYSDFKLARQYARKKDLEEIIFYYITKSYFAEAIEIARMFKYKTGLQDLKEACSKTSPSLLPRIQKALEEI